MIFYVFKDDDEDTLNVNEYLNTLKCTKYTNKNDITYNEMLFDKKWFDFVDISYSLLDYKLAKKYT